MSSLYIVDISPWSYDLLYIFDKGIDTMNGGWESDQGGLQL